MMLLKTSRLGNRLFGERIKGAPAYLKGKYLETKKKSTAKEGKSGIGTCVDFGKDKQAKEDADE